MREPQGIATLGIASKTEPKCKICNSAHRGEIEDLLALRSKGQPLRQPDGSEQKVTGQWILSIAEDRWGMRLNEPNLTVHFRKHFELGDPVILTQALNANVEDVIRQIENGSVPKRGVDEYLDLVITLGYENAKANPKRVTLDHALKAVAEKTKRGSDDTREKLLEVVGGAIAVAGKALDRGLPEPSTTDEDIVEAEVIPSGEIEA